MFWPKLFLQAVKRDLFTHPWAESTVSATLVSELHGLNRPSGFYYELKFFALLSFDSTYEFSKSFMNYITILTCVLLNVRFLRKLKKKLPCVFFFVKLVNM